jgi:hypothetical protein
MAATLPQKNWSENQVANWAKKVLKFSAKSVAILIKHQIDCEALPLYEKEKQLVKLGLPDDSAHLLFQKIQQMNELASSGIAFTVNVAINKLASGLSASPDLTPVQQAIKSCSKTTSQIKLNSSRLLCPLSTKRSRPNAKETGQ